MAVAIKVEGLSKTFKRIMSKEPVHAVIDLNLEVNEGEIFGFLGPNGAGKTTTIKMLLGLIRPTAGNAWLFDKSILDISDTSIKKQISYLPENPYFYDYMTPVELLKFYASLFGDSISNVDEKIEELLRTVGLYHARNQTLSEFSKGMQQRVGIAQALINDPKLLFFDEPTTGLDPIAHSDIRDLIIKLRDEGKTLFISSHQLSDVEMVCDRIAILNRGKMVEMGHLDDLLSGGDVEIVVDKLNPEAVKEIGGTCLSMTELEHCVVVLQKAGEELNKTIDVIRKSNGQILSIIPQRRSLEDLFVEVVMEGRK